MKRSLLSSPRTIFLLILCACIFQLSASGPKREMRGVWLATVWGIDWPSVSGTTQKIRQKQQDELQALLDRCEAANLTSVFFQVRGMADVMYESHLEPWSSFVSGKRGVSPGWDPLKFAVEECHRRGLECYAWVNPFRWSSGTDYNSAPDRRWKENGWLLSYGKYTVFNPGLEAVRQHVVDICREIADNYEIDGLVFDDYFYPNRIPENESAADYSLWQSEAPWMSFGDWRRANVHKTVADVSSMLADSHPGMRFGISPAGIAGKKHTSAPKWGMSGCEVRGDDWQYSEIYSDPLGWLYQGTVDFISPQIYWPTTHAIAPYEPLARWWSEAANLYGRHFYASITLAPLDKRNTVEERRELLRQVDANRSLSLDGDQGTVLYSAKHLHKLAPDLMKSHFALKALTPEVRHRAVGEVKPPVDLRLKGEMLSWHDSAEPAGPRRYAVYAFPKGLPQDELMEENGDGIRACYLLGVVYGREMHVGKSTSLAYAVTALDGYSTESEAVYLK